MTKPKVTFHEPMANAIRDAIQNPSRIPEGTPPAVAAFREIFLEKMREALEESGVSFETKKAVRKRKK